MAFSWEMTGRILAPGPFATLEPCEVLYEIDVPMIFTFLNDGFLHLAYICGQTTSAARFIVVPTSLQIVRGLKTGALDVRDALDQPWCWSVEVLADGFVAKCSITSLGELPDGIVPQNGVLLDASLAPVLSVKVDGRLLGRDNVPASVIKRAVDGAYSALKKLSEAHSTGALGRPSKAWKHFFDLPTQRLALGSFEISFREPIQELELLPDVGEATQKLRDLGKNLGDALGWAVDKSAANPPPALNLLEAMQSLVPPTHGVIETVTVSGSILGSWGTTFLLDRRVSKKVRSALTQARSGTERIDTLTGEARELDKDKLSFRLQTQESEEGYTCNFDEELYDDVLDFFADDQKMMVTLRLQKGSRIGRVLAITPGAGFDTAVDSVTIF